MESFVITHHIQIIESVEFEKGTFLIANILMNLPNLSLYRMVVLPAASKPTWEIKDMIVIAVAHGLRWFQKSSSKTKKKDAYHQYPHFLLPEQIFKQIGEDVPHRYCLSLNCLSEFLFGRSFILRGWIDENKNP